MKRIVSLMVSLFLTLAFLAGCAAPETTPPAESTTVVVTPSEAPLETPAEVPAESESRSFTDSLGRTVELPAQVTKIAVTGPMAQIVLFALAPDELVGVANAWDETAKDYFDPKYFNLPELGQLYGGKGEMNLETLLSSGAQVVVDVGEPKESAVADLDALQDQVGIPFVHITATTQTMGDAYRILGELLGKPEKAETLATYCETVYARSVEIAGQVEKANVLYCLGDAGQNVIAAGSYHAELLDLMTNNLAQVDEPSSRGTGNEVDMEQILAWNPEVLLFAPDSVYETIGGDPVWQQIAAVESGRYYEVPFGPYNWMMSPPSVQRYLGLMWIAQLLYPETAQYDLQGEVTNYFKLFYHCDITAEQYQALVADSIGKATVGG